MAAASSSSKPAISDAEIDRLLKNEATALQRQVEVCWLTSSEPPKPFAELIFDALQVDRILGAFKLNPYDILDLDVGLHHLRSSAHD